MTIAPRYNICSNISSYCLDWNKASECFEASKVKQLLEGKNLEALLSCYLCTVVLNNC